MPDISKTRVANKTLPYIEPTIRLIAGFLLTVIGISLYYQDSNIPLVLLGLLLFISLNLFQSSITKFCMMEKILKLIGFRSELDEIKTLNAETLRSADIQKGYIDTLNMLNEAVLELSEDGRILSASDGWSRLLSTSSLETNTLDRPLTDFIDGEYKSMVVDMLKKISLSKHKVHDIRFKLRRDDKTETWIGGTFMLQQVKNEPPKIRGVLRDITDSYIQERKIKDMALHDSLTNLPNRVMLEDTIERELARSRRYGKMLGLLFIDLDNFKQVNDIHGHKTGDNLLVSISQIMNHRLRASDTLARWGGDEFVVLLPDLKHENDLRNVAHTLMDKLEAELTAEGFNTYVTLSIGASIYPDDADTGEGLLVQADKALYFAKDQGRNNLQVYSDLRNSKLGFYDMDMTTRFTQAVKDRLIDVHYQPIVSSENQIIIGFEALARWHDEKYGWISPCTFIPLAENIGLIQELGRQVLEKAINHFSATAIQHPEIVLSVNLSNRQLMQADFARWLSDLVNGHHMQPAQLKLEITESLTQIGIVRANEILCSLRDLGFGLSIDDFGTGYSSLSHLHNLPVDELKIDISFVRRYTDPDGHVILKTISTMGQSLGMKLVAEGVETEECMQAMRDLGIDRLQGYYFSRPVPWNEAAGLLQNDDQQNDRIGIKRL